jgi:hypothetical protein
MVNEEMNCNWSVCRISLFVCLVGFAYARGSIRQNATNCFFDTLKEQQTANPEKTHYLRDIILQLPNVAECAEGRNSLIANIFFDKTKIGDYVRISKP